MGVHAQPKFAQAAKTFSYSMQNTQRQRVSFVDALQLPQFPSILALVLVSVPVVC